MSLRTQQSLHASIAARLLTGDVHERPAPKAPKSAPTPALAPLMYAAAAATTGSRGLTAIDVVNMLRWQKRLSTRDPKMFERYILDLAQDYSYLSAAERGAILTDVRSLRARTDPELASLWVEGMFRLGGSEVEASLREYATSSEGTEASRQLAHERADEMAAEREAEASLRARTSDAPASSASPLRLPLDPGFGDGVNDVRELTLTPEALRAEIQKLDPTTVRTALVASGAAPIVATDCDGTTWKHDIGEALFKWAVEGRRLRWAAHEKLTQFLEAYGIEATGDVNDNGKILLEAWESGELERRGAERGLSAAEVTRDYYGANVWCFAGHSVSQMKKWGRELFEREGGFSGKLFDGVREVLDTAREHGLIPYAVSASNQWIVEVGAEYLGIPPWRVRGVRTRVEDGIITTDLEGAVTYGPGKVEAIRELTGGRPAVAMGDSVDATDREMLESADLKLAVEPKDTRRPFVLARGQDNWRFVDYQRTRDGEAADTFVA